MKQKLILDLDTGIDDALAITYALGQSTVDIIGITTAFGNVTVETAVKNSIDILDLLGRSDIPVFAGAAHPWGTDFYKPSEHIYRIHGLNGIGNVDLGESKRSKAEQNAVDFIIESANKYGENLILFTAGPLTNLADAIKKDKEAINKIGKIVTMGCALTVPGNVTPFAEANIFNDPAAAKYVLESDIKQVLVGLDVTLKTMITGSHIKSWQTINSQASKAITELATYYYTNEYNDEEIGGAMHDPLALEVAVNPSIITNTLPINLTVETDGPSKGRTIANLNLLNEAEKSSIVCVDVLGEEFINKFTKTVSNVLNGIEKV